MGKKKIGAVEDEEGGSNEKYGKKKEYDPSFKGPIKDRGCTDVLCCLIFVGFLCGQTYISYLAFTTGDPNTVIYPTDYEGQICGTTSQVSNRTKLFFFDWLECFSPVTVATLQCPTPKVCVHSCPSETYSIYIRYASELISEDYSNVDWSDFICKYDIGPEYEVNTKGRSMLDLLTREDCAAYYAYSEPSQGRCIPFLNDDSFNPTGEIFSHITIFISIYTDGHISLFS